jgi:hypothetical protein
MNCYKWLAWCTHAQPADWIDVAKRFGVVGVDLGVARMEIG